MDAYQRFSRTELIANLKQRDGLLAEKNTEINTLKTNSQQQKTQINELKQRMANLEELLKKLQREPKRQAAPFSKNKTKKNPKPNGRKAGQLHGKHSHRQLPYSTQINETHIVELPNACPHCGEQHCIEQTGIDYQYQQDLPRNVITRKFAIYCGKCKKCARRVRSRHPLQTSDATGAAASQIGADAQALITDLNKTAGLSHGKVATVMQSLGLNITRGASAQIMQRTSKRLAPSYEQIKQHVVDSNRICADETGWRVNGQSSWLHVFTTEKATCYHIDTCRGSHGSKQVLPLDYQGTLVRDGWRGYDRYCFAAHQQCLAHLLQRCQRLIELAKARDRRGSAKFAQQIKNLLKSALQLRDEHRASELGEQMCMHRRLELQSELEKLIKHHKRDADNERFAKFLRNHCDEVLLFLREDHLDATNWRAEQAIRGCVVNRKVWGGNRTWLGAAAQAVLSSVLRSLRQQSQDVLGFISSMLRSMSPTLSLS